MHEEAAMERQDWDARYAAADLVWGIEPNRFVAEAFPQRVDGGRALDLACGEGRNAIWLASRGWKVTAVDFSHVAIERARSLSASEGVAVDWIEADVASWQPEAGAFDLVVISYLQVPEAVFRTVLAHARAALRTGGELFGIGHAVRNLEEGAGGPRDARVLWDADTVATALRDIGLEVDRCEEVLRPVADAPRPAIDLLVRAHRP
jgi:SAM-dependent methyltransferase